MVTLLVGAAAGAIGTSAMSAVLAGARLSGLMGPLPPRRLVARLAERSGASPAPAGPGFEASWVAAHMGYGMLCGALFALGRRRLPASSVAAGLLFGGLVWGASYLGLLPSLRLYGGPAEEDAATTSTMIAAHGVYGVSTALAERRMREPEPTFA